MDFQQVVQSCRSIRTIYSLPFHGLPDSVNFSHDGRQVLFLAGGSLYSAELPSQQQDDVERDSIDCDKMVVDPPVTIAASPTSDDDRPKTGWRKLCSSNPRRQLSRSEQLLRERMRVTSSGITRYDYSNDSDLITVHGPQCLVVERASEVCVAEFPEVPGALDYKLCPLNSELVGCVYQGEVWVLDSVTASKHRMTSIADKPGGQRSAGAPSFIIQEEFDRYTGYWWQPKMTQSNDRIYRILFEEVDESGVEVVHTFNPSNQTVEDYHYPRPGSANAPSKLHLLEFTLDGERKVQKMVKSLPQSFVEWFPDCSEYLARADWSPDGQWVWLQLINRNQNKLRLVFVPVEAFQAESSIEATPLITPPTSRGPYIAWEDTNPVWINVADIMTFVPCEDNSVQFIVSSERSGFRHLYLIKATPPTSSSDNGIPVAKSEVRQLTCGDWVVFGSKIWLDAEQNLVYFEGNCSTPLERHLYELSYSEGAGPSATPTQLTAPGYRHMVEAVDTTNGLVAVTSSSTASAPAIRVYRINHTPLLAAPLHTLKEEAGQHLHGLVYPPAGLVDGQKYPTILYVYGGPQIQMVTAGLSKHLPRIQVWCNHGYAVVIVDNRGSANRGLAFEAHLKEVFGEVEVEDQVAGLHAAASTVNYIDLERVAITGWSYGGYLSLMALAKRSDVFKLAISGAPVTDWMSYDTGYTERYLGVPPSSHPENPSSATESYTKSSVLTYAGKMPSEPHRLLIVHGMCDENVLFTHTSLLCDQLVALGKPYQLQLYTGERHGLRSHTSALHCDATVLAFLKRHL